MDPVTFLALFLLSIMFGVPLFLLGLLLRHWWEIRVREQSEEILPATENVRRAQDLNILSLY